MEVRLEQEAESAEQEIVAELGGLGSSGVRSHQTWGQTGERAAIVRSAAGSPYKHRVKAFRRCGTVRFGTGHSGTVQLGIVHLDTARCGTERSGSDLSDTAAGIHNTAAVHSSCSCCYTCDLRLDGDDVAAAAGTGEQREEAASDEALQDRPCRHLGRQILPVYSAQPADGGYSSCRLGDRVRTGVAQLVRHPS